MGQDHRLQAQRFELKYIISERQARQVRQFVTSFLELDENCLGRPELSYPVHSLYLDSSDLGTYWDTINGNKNRFKLRIRYYSDETDAPVFLEIKRRMNSCISKQRVAVRREAVRDVLHGRLPDARLVMSETARQLKALQDFARLVQDLDARPQMHVGYVREAYLPSTDNSARLTMDRQVRLEPDTTTRLLTSMQNPVSVWGRAVVLELKFTNRFPNWFKDLVQTFNLSQCGAAKYADGVTLLRGEKPQHRRQPKSNPDLQWPQLPCQTARHNHSDRPVTRNNSAGWAGLKPGMAASKDDA
jgi:SPX domain protein involved in polyphosphate accumulation